MASGIVPRVNYGKRCTQTDKYDDRCEMCEGHPGEHRFPAEVAENLRAESRSLFQRLLNVQHQHDQLVAAAKRVSNAYSADWDSEGYDDELQAAIGALVSAAEGRQD